MSEEESLNFEQEEDNSGDVSQEKSNSPDMENEDEDEDDGEEEDEDQDEDNEDDDENDDDEDDNDEDEDDDDDDDEEDDDKSKSQEEEEDEEEEDEKEEEEEEEEDEKEEEIEEEIETTQKKKRGRKSKADLEKMEKAKNAAEKLNQKKPVVPEPATKKPGKKGRKKQQVAEEEMEEEGDQEEQDEEKSDQDVEKESGSQEESMDEEFENEDEDEEDDNQDDDDDENDSDKDDQDKDDDDEEDKEDEDEDDMDDDDDNGSAGSDKSIREIEEEMEEEEDDQDGRFLQIDNDAFNIINKVTEKKISIFRLTDFYRYSSKKVQKLILKELKIHTNMRNRVQKDNREYIEKQQNFADRLLEEWKSHNIVQQFDDFLPDEANEEGNIAPQLVGQKSASIHHPHGSHGHHGNHHFAGKFAQNLKHHQPIQLKKNDLNIPQLEQTIIEDAKASKSDYFLHFNNIKQNFQITPQMIQRMYNPISSNEYFTQLRQEMVKKIINGENKFTPEEEEEDIIEDLYEKEYMRLNNGMRKDAKIKNLNGESKKERKSKLEDLGNQSDYINEDEDNDSYKRDESDNFMENEDDSNFDSSSAKKKKKKSKNGKEEGKNKKKDESKDSDNKKKEKKGKKSKKGKSKSEKQEKRRKKDSHDSSMSFGGDDSDRLSLSRDNSSSQMDSFSNDDSSKASNSSDERSSGFGGSDDDSEGNRRNKKQKNSKKGKKNNRKNSESMDVNSDTDGREGRKQKNDNNESGNSQEKTDTVILNAMSVEEREISRERNKNSDIQSINLLQIKQRQYKENCMDLQDKSFLDNFFKFDFNNKEIIQTKNQPETKGQPFQIKFGDDIEKKINLFGEPIDMEKAIPFAPNSKMFRLTQEEKDFIHIEEPKQGNFINIQISSNSDKNKQKQQTDKDKQKELLQQQQQALLRDGNSAINQHKKNLLAKTEKLPKETFVVKRQLIAKQFDYYNSELLNCGWNQPKEHYNNILIDLNDPQFFLEKVNSFFSTQKKERKEAFYKWDQLQKKLHIEERGDTHSINPKSIISGLVEQGAQGGEEDQPAIFMQATQPPQQQYPVNLKTYIEQKKRDKNEIPQKYDHSRVAKQFEFNHLTQDENVFKDYHYWDLSQKIRLAQRQYEKQCQEYMQYLNTIQQLPPTTPLLQSQSSQRLDPMSLSTPKQNSINLSGMSQATAFGGVIQLPPLQSSLSQPGQPQTPTSTTPSNIISRPMVQPTQSINKISIKLQSTQSTTKDTIVSIPNPNSNAQSGIISNPSNPNLITIQSSMVGKGQQPNSVGISANVSQEQKGQAKERKEKGAVDKNLPPQPLDQTKQNLQQQRQPPIKNGMLNEWKAIPIGMQPTDYCLKTINPDMKSLEISEEKVESFKHFKSKRHLSLKKDIVIMMEYLEEDPLVLQNIGMNSKIFRYAYHNRIFKKIENDSKKQETLNQINQSNYFSQQNSDNSNELDQGYKTIGQFQSYMHKKAVDGQLVDFEKELLKFKQVIQDYLGELGRVIFYDEADKTNLFGQLDDQEEGKESLGITVLENHLFKAPIFKQRLPETDFLLVRQQENDKCNYYLRPIEYVYIVGQIEPTKSIYRPRSRDITPYMKNCMNTFIMIKIQKEKKVHFQDLLNNFNKNLTETQIRQQIKKKNLKPELNNKNTFVPKDNEQDSDNENAHDPELTPEQACMFEKMLSHVYHLSNEIGLKELRTTEKLKNVLAKFQKDRPDEIRNYTIAKLITDKLSLTPWSLSNNFAHDKQKLYLEGLGDPTNGHGGYSFIKRPLKKRSEKDEKQNNKEDEKQKEDLRKLNIAEINRILQLLGINLDTKISETKKQRWAKIELIKKKLDEIDLSEREDLQSLIPFKRKDRKTVKEAEQHYQKKINSLFHKLISYLNSQEIPEVQNEVIQDDVEYLPLEFYIEEEKKIREKKKKQLKMQRPAVTTEGGESHIDESKADEPNEQSDEDEYEDDEEDDDEDEQGDDSMSDQG